MKWSSHNAMLRVLALSQKLPREVGLDGQSTVISALSVRAQCLAVCRDLSERVTRAVQCPAPHPEFGDDGTRDTAREWALQELEAVERWVDFHHQHRWNFEFVKKHPTPFSLPPDAP